jgi:hypothetical protein
MPTNGAPPRDRISPDVLAKARRAAQAEGIGVSEYVDRLVTADAEAKGPTWSEVRDQLFDALDMSPRERQIASLTTVLVGGALVLAARVLIQDHGPAQ